MKTETAKTDLTWLRAHSPVFSKLEEDILVVKKSEEQYREFKRKNYVDNDENTPILPRIF